MRVVDRIMASAAARLNAGEARVDRLMETVEMPKTLEEVVRGNVANFESIAEVNAILTLELDAALERIAALEQGLVATDARKAF